MVILCRHDGPERQEAIASRFAVDDDGLAPFLLPRVGDQPPGGVRSRARTERQHEAHWMRGPLLGETCRRGDRVSRKRQGDHIEAKPTVEHDPSPGYPDLKSGGASGRRRQRDPSRFGPWETGLSSASLFARPDEG